MRKRKGQRAGAAIFAAVLLLLTGCGSSDGRTQTVRTEYFKIGYIKYQANDAYIDELTEHFRDAVDALQTEHLKISVTVKDASGSQRTENQIAEELIDGGSDILCVNLVDRTAPSSIIDMVKESDTPVIFINREPVREDLMLWDKLYYVGSDATESGELQGELAAEWLKEHPEADRSRDGKIQYILLEGEPDHQDAIIRTEKSVSTLVGEGAALEKLSYQIANWNRAQAKTRMSQMITQYGTDIELVLANNDEMAIGAAEAYVQANITESERPAIFGIDGTQAGLQAVKDGTVTGTVYHDSEGEAEAMARLALALYNEKQNSGDKDTGSSLADALGEFELVDGKCIYLPYSKVDSENLSAYLKS